MVLAWWRQTGPVRDDDRRRMRAIARDLASIETDEEPGPDILDRIVAAADRDRALLGIPPLQRDEARPEEELYRRARALGLRRLRG